MDVCRNCLNCVHAIVYDAYGNMYVGAVYCPINRCLVPDDDVCCEYEEVNDGLLSST